MHTELYDHGAEQSALAVVASTASMHLDKALVALDQAGLSEDAFHLPANKILFTIFSGLLKAGQPLDPLTVKAELERTQGKLAVSWEYLCEVTLNGHHLHESVLPPLADQLKALSLRRKLLEELREAASNLQRPNFDPGEVAGKLAGRLAEMSASGKRVVTLNNAMDGIIDHIQAVHEGKAIPVVKTGIKSLDGIIGGFQPTLNLVGALPGVGKSAFIATCTVNIAQAGLKVGVFSLEDAAEWIGWRLLSKESGISQHKLRFEPLPGEHFGKLEQGVTRLHAYASNIYLVDGSDSRLTAEQIVREATNLIVNHGVRCIIIDHLGEVRLPASGERHDLALSDCLAALRSIANKFSVPVVVAAHLKRREGLGPGNEPQLSDFAGTSGAERKARVALGLSREPDSDEMTISVLKNTNGKAGFKCSASFIGQAAMLKAS